jgi:hypothetical protein
MTNVQVPSPIPLAGRGFVAKLQGNYQPGEYRRLSNAIISDEGFIRNRRNMYTPQHANYAQIDNPKPILGHIDSFTLIANSSTQHKAIDHSTVIDLWLPSTLPQPVAGWHRIESAFLYNGRYYWLTLKYDPAGAVGVKYTYHAYHKAVTALGLADPALTVASMEVATLQSFETKPVTVNSFIQKDRLWIVTESRLYFSKATDPATFAIPEGGFIGVRDQVIRDVTFLGDSIYIIGQNEVHLLTYTTDPNEDALLRKIADVGGDSVTVHGSNVYFVNRLGIYEIFNTAVNKINDLRLEYPYALDESDLKILSFEHYLIVIARNSLIYNNNDTGYWFSREGLYPESMNYNVFFLNTVNGATHVLDFTDGRDQAIPGFIVDAYVNPVRDSTNDYKWIFVTNRWTGIGTSKGNVYYMRPQNDWSVYDEVRSSAGAVGRYKHNIEIEIDGYVPDGNEYAMKKFRSMQIMAKFPGTDFQVTPSFDNNDFDALRTMHVENKDFPEGRPHYPARLPLMQRAKSLNLLFETTSPDVALAVDGVWDQLEISDVQVLWTYTSRLTEKRYQTLDS